MNLYFRVVVEQDAQQHQILWQ